VKLGIRGHPERRMRQRGITRADVENALTHHHTSVVSGRSKSVLYIGPGMNGHDLKVWTMPPGIIDEDTTITIKSVAWKDQEDA